jgi:hypothetical protein
MNLWRVKTTLPDHAKRDAPLSAFPMNRFAYPCTRSALWSMTYMSRTSVPRSAMRVWPGGRIVSGSLSLFLALSGIF